MVGSILSENGKSRPGTVITRVPDSDWTQISSLASRQLGFPMANGVARLTIGTLMAVQTHRSGLTVSSSEKVYVKRRLHQPHRYPCPICILPVQTVSLTSEFGARFYPKVGSFPRP